MKFEDSLMDNVKKLSKQKPSDTIISSDNDSYFKYCLTLWKLMNYEHYTLNSKQTKRKNCMKTQYYKRVEQTKSGNVQKTKTATEKCAA